MDYTTLSTQEKIDLAHQRVHGLETDHFNTALLGSGASPTEQSLNKNREEQIIVVKSTIVALEKELAAESVERDFSSEKE